MQFYFKNHLKNVSTVFKLHNQSLYYYEKLYHFSSLKCFNSWAVDGALLYLPFEGLYRLVTAPAFLHFYVNKRDAKNEKFQNLEIMDSSDDNSSNIKPKVLTKESDPMLTELKPLPVSLIFI